MKEAWAGETGRHGAQGTGGEGGRGHQEGWGAERRLYIRAPLSVRREDPLPWYEGTGDTGTDCDEYGFRRLAVASPVMVTGTAGGSAADNRSPFEGPLVKVAPKSHCGLYVYICIYIYKKSEVVLNGTKQTLEYRQDIHLNMNTAAEDVLEKA